MSVEFSTALQNLNKIYPGYDDKVGYEIAGFVWFQGWNDVLQWPTVNEYAFNMANLIRDVRKEVETPNMPVIIGELGQGGIRPLGSGANRHRGMRIAQQSVTLLPEFRNNSLYVPTSPYVISNASQYNGGYHYFGRADTYFHIGEAFGKGILPLLNLRKRSPVVHLSPAHSGEGSRVPESLFSLDYVSEEEYGWDVGEEFVSE